MSLNLTEKARLAKRFAPVLFLDKSGDDFPDPTRSVYSTGRPFVNFPYDNKMLWGRDGDTRSPLIPRGGIDFNSIQLPKRRNSARLSLKRRDGAEIAKSNL